MFTPGRPARGEPAKARRARSRRWLPILGWALLVMVLVGLARGTGDLAVRAIPLEGRGNVALTPPGRAESRRLEADETLPTGSRVKTPLGGRLVLSLVPGVTMVLEQEAEVTLDELITRKNGIIVERRFAR